MPVTRNLPAAQYHAMPALSAGFIWEADAECALKAWLASPWNPDREPEKHAPHFDVGVATHLAILEPHLLSERVVLHEFDDYKTNTARAIRDDAYIAGKVPLKPSEWRVIEEVRRAIERKPYAMELFADGDPEITLTWEWDGMACKCRPDWLSEDRKTVVDLKTAATVNPRAISRKAALEGWHVRAAWYLSGTKAATGIMPDRYLFLAGEKGAPHMVEIFRLADRALIKGEQIIMRRLAEAKACFQTGEWPSYGDGKIVEIDLPGWVDFQHAEREEAGEFEI